MSELKKSVLIVEDDNSLRNLISVILEEENYHVIVAEDGKIALDKLSASPVDLIISDIYMPNMTGIELGSYCKQHHPEIPFILMTGGNRGSQGETEEEFFRSSMDITNARIVLKKPFDIVVIIKTVEDILSQEA